MSAQTGQTKAQYLASLADTACNALISEPHLCGDLAMMSLAHLQAITIALHTWSHDKYPAARFSVAELRAAIVRRALRGNV